VDSITDIFFALDTNLCCTYWNKAAEKQTGIPLKNALTRPFRELFPDIPLIEVEERIKKVLDCKIADSFCCDSHTNNRYSYYEISIYPFLKGVTLLFRHMSEYRSTEELQKTQEEIKKQLAQSQEYRILGQLTSGVAHEVRNPLNAISVVMEALFLDLGDNPDFLPYKEHIFTHVDRLKRLMQDLLELGKPIERSKVVTLHLDDLIRESISLWKSSGPHDSFNVLLDVSHDEELKIKGDPLKLQQVFLNILDNASQHSAKGSTIKVSFFKENDFCTVTIVDQGSGLNADYFKHMFEPFFTTRKKGTGLGLAIVKHIVEVHGGTIAIANSESGSGCTVIIRLPLNQKIGKAQKMCACIGK
jgi:signal transduction histidine kinase